jgi:hypothetical protein
MAMDEHTTGQDKREQEQAYERLVKEVADRVWELWQQELRHERERCAQPQKD